MKAKLLMAALFVCTVLCVLALSGCNKSAAPVKLHVTDGAYDTELDWKDNSKLIRLGYQESQGKRIFYQYCVWCHADASPAGPSNRSKVAPMPPLMNDGEKLNGESDEYMRNIITLGGSAVGKSPTMPPYGKTLSAAEITDVIAFTRAIAQPGYRKPGRPGLQTWITEQIWTGDNLVEGVGFKVSVNGSVQTQSGVAPTGTIAFFVGATQLGNPVPVIADRGLNGAAPFFWINSTVTIPNAGSYALTAQYSGDSNYAASTTSTTINVLHHATASISVSPTTVNYGGTVKITGIIDTTVPSSNTALKPTGTVTLSGTADGQIKSGVTTTTTADESGNWEIQLSATAKPSNGEHFVITYNSDSNYGSASASNPVIVNLPDFSLTANPGLLTVTAGQNVSSTITIAPLTSMSSTVVLTCSDPVLVNVACTISPSSIRLANNASGTATVTLTTLGPSSSGTASAQRKRRRGMMWISKPAAWGLGGSCVCTALLLMLLWLMPAHKRSYRVALGLAASCVVALALGCGEGGGGNNPVPTTVSITASATKIPAANMSSLTLTATVTSSKAVTGTVNFWENGNDGALAPPATLVNGTATAQVALPFPGTHEIYAQYSGDANNRGSQSSTIDVVATGSARAQIQGTTGPVTNHSSVYVTIQ